MTNTPRYWWDTGQFTAAQMDWALRAVRDSLAGTPARVVARAMGLTHAQYDEWRTRGVLPPKSALKHKSLWGAQSQRTRT